MIADAPRLLQLTAQTTGFALVSASSAESFFSFRWLDRLIIFFFLYAAAMPLLASDASIDSK